MKRHPNNTLMLLAMLVLLALLLGMINKAYAADEPAPAPLPYTLSFAESVAAKCKGEASFAIEECSCTVKNRLDRGWSQRRVLSAYYAPPQIPTTQETSTAYETLNELEPCDERFYFLYSKSDTIYLGISHLEPITVLLGATGEIRIFEYTYHKRNQ